VGRSDRKAYAYFTYRRGKVLTEVSVKRLEAIREYTRFGSGFQIALRDLEIRGAGNLLGAEQSGHLDSVGYDMFMKILSEAVLEERGEKVKEAVECTVDLALDGYIPEKFVPYPAQRMDLYRKIASVKTEEDSLDLTDEILDRFGEPPKSVQNLIRVALLRAKAEEMGCEKIVERGGAVTFFFAHAREDALALLAAVYASRFTLSLGAPLSVSVKKDGKERAMDLCHALLDHYRGFLDEMIKQESKGNEP
jgi:transcription-repair coupling factor (superfamily II helicase)